MPRIWRPRSIALTTLLLIPFAATRAAEPDPELTAAVEAILSRVERMEARLVAIENRLAANEGPAFGASRGSGPTHAAAVEPAILPPQPSSAAPAPTGTVALAESLSTLATRFEALETRLEPAGGSPGFDDSDEPEAASTPASRVAYLPSRGWRESMYYGSEALDLEIHTFFELELIDSGPDGARSGVSTFDNHHANIFFEAALRPNLTAHSEIELEHSGDVVEVDQAFFEWTVNDALSLDFGRFYTPFGIERFVWYSPTNALVSRPEPMRRIVPGNFYANGVMGQGVLDAGESSIFTYEVALSDGLGDAAVTDRRGSRQTRDNNSARALSGRLAVAANRNFEIGASYHGQRYSSDGDLDLTFLGFDLAGRWKGWEARAEYVEASLDTSENDGFGGVVRGPDLEQDGWYTQVGYNFVWFRDLLPSLGLVGRYDRVDLDRSLRGADDQQYLSLGLNALIYDHFRAKVEYRFADEDGPRLDNDTLLTQFVIDF